VRRRIRRSTGRPFATRTAAWSAAHSGRRPNSIYAKIGYRPIRDDVEIDFSP
jgi:hypothetical protein